MERMASGCVRLSRSLLPRTSRFQASKRAPRNASSSSRSAWIIVPMAPSRTRMRSAASRRSVDSAFDVGASLFIGLRALLHSCGSRRAGRAMVRPHAEQVADRINKIGAVHGVKMEVSDAVIDEIDHLFGGDGRGDQLPRRRIVVETVEAVGKPGRNRGAGALGEILGLLEILHRWKAR